MDPTPRRTQPAALHHRLDAIRPARPVHIRDNAEAPAILLRPLAQSDRAAFIALVADSLDHLGPWLPVLADGTEPDAFFDDELERAARARRTGDAARFVAESQGRIVGAFALTNITRGLTLQADASWWIGLPHVRRGHARRGLAKLLRHAFADAPAGLGLHRVMATIAPDNEPSLRLARALGFTRLESQDHHLRVGPAWKRHHCFVADSRDYSGREIKPTPPAGRSPGTLGR
jgi:ribosomal-protein-alanine N-acetyltransferase